MKKTLINHMELFLFFFFQLTAKHTFGEVPPFPSAEPYVYQRHGRSDSYSLPGAQVKFSITIFLFYFALNFELIQDPDLLYLYGLSGKELFICISLPVVWLLLFLVCFFVGALFFVLGFSCWFLWVFFFCFFCFFFVVFLLFFFFFFFLGGGGAFSFARFLFLVVLLLLLFCCCWCCCCFDLFCCVLCCIFFFLFFFGGEGGGVATYSIYRIFREPTSVFFFFYSFFNHCSQQVI